MDIQAVRQACADIRESDHLCDCGRIGEPCRTAVKRAAIEPAAWVAEHHSDGRVYPYGYGLTKDAAHRDAQRQVCGVDNRMSRHLMAGIRCRPVDADEASEICEYLATPWN